MAADPRQSTSRGRKARRQIKRVVFFSLRIPEMSGGSVAIVNLSHALRDRGYEVEHISQYPPTWRPEFPTTTLIDREELHTGPTLRAGGRKTPTKIATGAAKLLIKKIDRRLITRRLLAEARTWDTSTAVVFTHAWTRRSLASTGYRRPADGPLFIGQHHTQAEVLDNDPQLCENLDKYFCHGGVDVITALTSADAEVLEGFLGVPCVGIPNPLSTDDRRQSTLTSHRAVTLARFSAEKQLDLMIRAFSKATEAMDGEARWTLDIYGEGETHSQLEDTIHHCGSADRVSIHQPTTTPLRVYESAELNLLSSSFEGFGMTIVEAGSCGVPSIVFDCSTGVRRAVGEGGLLVSPTTELAFAEALKSLINDEPRIRSLGRAARANAEAFTPDAIASRWEEVLSPTHDWRDYPSHR